MIVATDLLLMGEKAFKKAHNYFRMIIITGLYKENNHLKNCYSCLCGLYSSSALNSPRNAYTDML